MNSAPTPSAVPPKPSPWSVGSISLLTVVLIGMVVWTLLPGHSHGWRGPMLWILLLVTNLLNLARFAFERRRRQQAGRS